MSMINPQKISKAVVSSALMVGTGWAIAIAAPASAATFALSESSFDIFNFSVSPSSTTASTFTDTLVISLDGEVVAEADAEADFLTPPSIPAFAGNFASSVTLGNGLDYLGVAESYSSVIGVFEIDAGSTFSFDFQGSMLLAAAIDDPQLEFAGSFGDLGFSLDSLDPAGVPGELLDEFNLLAFLNSPGSHGVELEYTQNILAGYTIEKDFIGNQKFFRAEFSGTYSQKFWQPQHIQLSEDKTGLAIVSAEPQSVLEPSILLGAVISMGVGLLRRRV